MEEITDQQLSEIVSPLISEEDWEYRLGLAIDSALSGAVDHFEFNAKAFGKQMWKGFREDLYEHFCSDGKPREWLMDIVTGDIRNLVIGVTSAITAKYNVTIAIGIPIAALLIKTGMINYCSVRSGRIEDELFSLYVESLKKHSKKKHMHKKRKGR